MFKKSKIGISIKSTNVTYNNKNFKKYSYKIFKNCPYKNI